MTITAAEILYEIKKHFHANILTASYKLFIEPLDVYSFDNEQLILKAPSEWIKSVIDKRFKDMLQTVVETHSGKALTVNIIVDDF